MEFLLHYRNVGVGNVILIELFDVEVKTAETEQRKVELENQFLVGFLCAWFVPVEPWMFMSCRFGRAVVRCGVNIMVVFDVDSGVFSIDGFRCVNALGGIWDCGRRHCTTSK